MIRLPAFWRRQYLIAEGVLAILCTVCFGIWYWRFDGAPVAAALLEGNRATLYGTMASIFGSLLGFVITVASIVLGFSASERLVVVRESAQYSMVWNTFRATIRALALATIVALLCLLIDRDKAPVPFFVVIFVLVSLLSFLRLARTIWVLENIIRLVTGLAAGQNRRS